MVNTAYHHHRYSEWWEDSRTNDIPARDLRQPDAAAGWARCGRDCIGENSQATQINAKLDARSDTWRSVEIELTLVFLFTALFDCLPSSLFSFFYFLLQKNATTRCGAGWVAPEIRDPWYTHGMWSDSTHQRGVSMLPKLVWCALFAPSQWRWNLTQSKMCVYVCLFATLPGVVLHASSSPRCQDLCFL